MAVAQSLVAEFVPSQFAAQDNAALHKAYVAQSGMLDAVNALRRAHLVPTQSRILIAGLVFSGATLALTAAEVCERAQDADLHVPLAEAEHVLEELRLKGVLPRLFASNDKPAFNLSRAARVLQAMGNPHRLKVLRELSTGERCAGELGQAVGLQPSALSQHLARLKTDGLVQQRRSASRIYYSLAGDVAASVLRAFAA